MFNTEKMYTFMTGYANGANLTQTQKALTFAKTCHQYQQRKNGDPYYIHPLTMACHATAMHIQNDHVLAAILLHDVVEDCNIRVSELPVSDAVKTIVTLLTFNITKQVFNTTAEKENAKKAYYTAIKTNPEATLAKIIDRCHNVSSMAGVFTDEKLREYIDETHAYIIPLMRNAKDFYPEYRDQIFLLKYHINSVLIAISAGLNAKNGVEK